MAAPADNRMRIWLPFDKDALRDTLNWQYLHDMPRSKRQSIMNDIQELLAQKRTAEGWRPPISSQLSTAEDDGSFSV